MLILKAQRLGKEWVRCDTVTDQPGILSYYAKLGFHEEGRFVYECMSLVIVGAFYLQ